MEFARHRGGNPAAATGTAAAGAPEAQADLVEVFLGERRMELKRDGQTIRRYRVALGFAPECHKEREGDGRTPEGSYTVDARNPQSAFHLVTPGARVVIHP